MSAWEAYPEDYRDKEVRSILSAVQGGECVSVIGLSGAGKSNLMGFLYHRRNNGRTAFRLVDGNRALPRSSDGLARLIGQSLGEPSGSLAGDWAALEAAAAREIGHMQMADPPGGTLCLLLDRYDALDDAERALAAGPLRALRDVFKYQLTLVTTTRRPLAPNDELSELFYANTIWLGPLSHENARWSAAEYAARRGQVWEAGSLDRLIELSWGYPSLLRACCEARAAGAPLEIEAMRAHPAVQRRVREFWADAPSPQDLRQSGLTGHPLLAAGQPAVSAESPELTASEHRLLAYFQAHPGEVCAKDDLIRSVWPEERVVDGLRDDSLAQLIRRLRQKVEPDASTPVHIQTVPGRGYRYMP